VLAPFLGSFQARSHLEFNYTRDSNYLSPLFIQTPCFPDHDSMPTLRKSTVHAYSAQKTAVHFKLRKRYLPICTHLNYSR